jgi:hypothetical protein
VRPEIVIFPVKFPVCREFNWRLVRCALRRQPGIPVFGLASQGRDFLMSRLGQLLPKKAIHKCLLGAFAGKVDGLEQLYPSAAQLRPFVPGLVGHLEPLGTTRGLNRGQ